MFEIQEKDGEVYQVALGDLPAAIAEMGAAHAVKAQFFQVDGEGARGHELLLEITQREADDQFYYYAAVLIDAVTGKRTAFETINWDQLKEG